MILFQNKFICNRAKVNLITRNLGRINSFSFLLIVLSYREAKVNKN